jgi:hypothetical protein
VLLFAGPAGAAPGPRPRCAAPIPQQTAPLGVDVTLDVSSTTPAEGEPLGLELTVDNGGVLPIPYSHGGQTHDFWIRDERGAVWIWSQGKVFTDILVNTYLMPGETKTARARWFAQCTTDGKGLRRGLPGPGRYVARALWVSEAGDEDGAWWSNEVSFRIT